MYSENELNNLTLAYDQARDAVEARRRDIVGLDVRLGTLLGVSGVLLRFAFDLPGSRLRVVVVVLCCVAAVLAVVGLMARKSGYATTPGYLVQGETLMKDWVRVKTEVVKTWCEGLPDQMRVAEWKAMLLMLAIWCLGGAIVLSGVMGLMFESLLIC